MAFVLRAPVGGFIETDLRCLKEIAEVELLEYEGSSNFRYLLRSWSAARRCDCVYVFFGSEHGLFPVLCFRARRRRVLLVPAGYDYANVPEKRYGLAARHMGWLPKLLGRLASVALPISKQTMWEFLELVPSAAPVTYLAYLALEPDRWTDPVVGRDLDLAVTVGFVDDEAWTRKGVDRFVQAAAEDPHRRYVLAGEVSRHIKERLSAEAPPNLTVTGRLSHDELRRLLWSAGIYVQLSWHETFGVAMAEAMLCGCVPVISSSVALGEVAGRWAVRPVDSETDAAAIGRAANLGQALDRTAMREDMARRFSVSARQAILDKAVGGG